ncbi:hemolysin secretion protein D [Nitrospira sp. KM1]|uniref:efflux RND transporter periplasmic adaptor subunit n=1 Tax=Nitrospira sp. KM1 TaxID=1936990 RepID=UPI0013A72073|nr:efflux RND transporter periplasmic adaptor subunit [Nitrospira sp. KM1]BCA56659.1 hemolysin secretion protein D [Nitrospira sp. KM1]
MSGSPVRDADVSVLTLPRDEPPRSHDPRRTRFTWVLVVLVVGVCVALVYLSGVLVLLPPEVDTMLVRVSENQVSSPLLSASGYVVAQRQASVASKGTGRLEYLSVTVGSRVKAGDVIARIQQDDVQAIQHQARARLDVAKAALANARAELRDAELSQERAAALLPHQFVSQAEFDTAVNRLHRAQAAVRSSSAAITAAEADVQTADVMLDSTLIRTPFDGIVLKKFAEIGEVVAPMASSASSRGAVVLIADMNSLVVEAEVSESSLAGISHGQPAAIVVNAVPGKRHSGTVEQIVPTADRSKGTVLVKIRFNELDDRVFPEMSANVSFLSSAQLPSQISSRMFVPASSLSRANGRTVVFVLEDEVAREIPVEELGRRGGDSEIQGALPPSVKVILAPPVSLTSGAKVRARAGN